MGSSDYTNVYYDNETTGLAKPFDQITQFAAIRAKITDKEILQILDEINIRMRRLPYVVMTPTALVRTRIWPADIEQAPYSAYEGIKKVYDWMMSASPADFKGHNTIQFDEVLLRYGFMRALLPVYVTNTNGNQRGDTLKIAHAVDLFAPKAMRVQQNKNKKGQYYRAFNLGSLVYANRIQGKLDEQHEAMNDTIMAANFDVFAKKVAPHVWERMRLNQSKVDVQTFLEETPLCVYGQLVFGSVYPRIGVPVGVNPIRDTEYALFDVLRYDPKTFAKYTVEQMAEALMGDKKPVYVVAMNKQPILGPADWYPPYTGEGLGAHQEELKPEDREKIQERMAYLRTNYKLRWTIKQAMQMRTQIYEDRNKAERAASADRVARESKPDMAVPGCNPSLPASGESRNGGASLFQTATVSTTSASMPQQARSGPSKNDRPSAPPADKENLSQTKAWYMLSPEDGVDPVKLAYLPRARNPVQGFCQQQLSYLVRKPLLVNDRMDEYLWKDFCRKDTDWHIRAGMVLDFKDKRLRNMALLQVFISSPESLDKRQHDLVTRWANWSMRKTQPDIYTSVEDHLYDGFPSAYDQQMMLKFHDVKTTWNERADMIGQFSKTHYNEIAALIVYAENPGSLPLGQRNEIAQWIHARVNKTEELTQEYEEKAKTCLTGDIHERVDLVGTFDAGDCRYMDLRGFNHIIATIAALETSPEMRELYKDKLEPYFEPHWNVIADKMISGYRKRFIGPEDERQAYKEPTSCIPYVTTGKALIDALFLKYEGAYEILSAERKVEEIRNVLAEKAQRANEPEPSAEPQQEDKTGDAGKTNTKKSKQQIKAEKAEIARQAFLDRCSEDDLYRAIDQMNSKRRKWEEAQPQINAIVDYILDISKEPEMAKQQVAFVSSVEELPEELRGIAQEYIDQNANRSQIQIPLDVILKEYMARMQAGVDASVTMASQPQEPAQTLPGGEIPQSEIVVPVMETQPVEEPQKTVRKPRKPKTPEPKPYYGPQMADHLL